MGSFWPVQNSLLSKNQQAQPILAPVSRPNIQIQQLKENPLVKLLKAVDQDAASVFLARFYGRACISFSKCKKKKKKKKPEFVGGDIARGLLLRSSKNNFRVSQRLQRHSGPFNPNLPTSAHPLQLNPKF
ncbi:hypothetical protein ACFX1R_028821 [Malus domestica]